QAEDGIRDATVTGVQTCALPIFYILGVVGIAYHLANGLWSFMTMGWGITVSKSGMRWLERLSIAFFVLLLALGWAAIYGLYRGEIGRASCRERVSAAVSGGVSVS